MRKILTLTSTLVFIGGVATACGGDDDAGEAGDGGDRPMVVVTTNILGDVVAAASGGLVEVSVVMPIGADPHDFAPSAKAATDMENADLLVVNGAGFEAGMLDVVNAVADTGTPVFAFADVADLTTRDDEEHADEEHADEDHADEDHADEDHADEEHADEEHADEEHADEDHADEDHADEDHADEDHADEDHADEDHADEDHAHHDGEDPHLWTDPTIVAAGVAALGEVLAELDGIDTDALAGHVDDYLAELDALDAEITDDVARIPADRRVLVTNHEVFGYFADRYGFDVVGAVVPSLTTNAESSARELEALADVIRSQEVPAIFVETTQSTRLAESIASEVGGDVGLFELYAESLSEADGPAATYLDMMRHNTSVIVEALAP